MDCTACEREIPQKRGGASLVVLLRQVSGERWGSGLTWRSGSGYPRSADRLVTMPVRDSKPRRDDPLIQPTIRIFEGSSRSIIRLSE